MSNERRTITNRTNELRRASGVTAERDEPRRMRIPSGRRTCWYFASEVRNRQSSIRLHIWARSPSVNAKSERFGCQTGAAITRGQTDKTYSASGSRSCETLGTAPLMTMGRTPCSRMELQVRSDDECGSAGALVGANRAARGGRACLHRRSRGRKSHEVREGFPQTVRMD